MDPNCRSRRHESADLRGGWIGSVTPAAAVGSGTLVAFSGSGICTPLAAAAGRSFQFNVSSRSVSFEVANEKVSDCADHASLTPRSASLLLQSSGASSEHQETPQVPSYEVLKQAFSSQLTKLDFCVVISGHPRGKFKSRGNTEVQQARIKTQLRVYSQYKYSHMVSCLYSQNCLK